MDPAVKKIKEAKVKSKIEHFQKRLKCTSFMLMAIGVIGVCSGVYAQFSAKHHAMMIANFPPPPHHGPPHGPPHHDGPPPHHGGHGKFKKHHPPPPRPE